MKLDKEFYSINEASEVLNVHPATIYNQRSLGRGIGHLFSKPGIGKLRISREKLEKIMEGCET